MNRINIAPSNRDAIGMLAASVACGLECRRIAVHGDHEGRQFTIDWKGRLVDYGTAKRIEAKLREASQAFAVPITVVIRSTDGDISVTIGPAAKAM